MSTSSLEAEGVMANLKALDQRSRQAQIELLQGSFPSILQDAQQYVTQTGYVPGIYRLPWVAREGELGEIEVKYGVYPGVWQPGVTRDVTPVTRLFLRASELVYYQLVSDGQIRDLPFKRP